jgi:hypothetical protein
MNSFTTGEEVDHTFGISLLHLAVQRAVLEQPLADFFGQQFHLRVLRFVAAPIRGLSGVGNRTGVRESAPGRAATE